MSEHRLSPVSGFAKFEQNAEMALARTRVEHAAEQMLGQRQEIIQARANSPEVSALNDRAELDMFGKIWGRAVNPETGKALPDGQPPITGKLLEITQNPRNGKSATERNAVARKFTRDVTKLQANGFELCQAKLVMNLRESDKDHKATLIASLIRDGLSAEQAEKKANKVYARKDKNRLDLIKNGGAFTLNDYSHLAAGVDPYAKGEAAANDDKPTEIMPDPVVPEAVLPVAKKGNLFKRAYARMGVASTNFREKLNDEEKGKRRRIGLYVGVAAVTAAGMYAALKWGHIGRGSDHSDKHDAFRRVGNKTQTSAGHSVVSNHVATRPNMSTVHDLDRQTKVTSATRVMVPRGGQATANDARMHLGERLSPTRGGHAAGASVEHALPNQGVNSGDSFKYPWNWAEKTFGRGKGTKSLFKLADLAAKDGHKITSLGNRFAVDGHQDTATIIKILSKYSTAVK